MITIVLPISRKEWLKPVFDSLEALIRPDDTELLIILDGNKELEYAIDRRLENTSYKSATVVPFGNSPASTINDRRYRISAIHNIARHYLPAKCNYVFSVEDDTTYPPETLAKLLEVFGRYEGCGFVEGVELGRHKSKYVGAWLADDPNNAQRIESLMPGDDTIVPIDAGGLYCALIAAEPYKAHHFEPYDNQGTNGLSCDVNFGLWLKQQGYDNFIDWSIECDHIGDKGSVNLGNTKPIKVVFENHKGKWRSWPER